MRISDWSSDVCSSDLAYHLHRARWDRRGRSDPHRHGKERDRGQGGVQLQGRVAGDGDGGGSQDLQPDRKSVGEGKSVSVRVVLGGRRIIQKKKYRMTRVEHEMTSRRHTLRVKK